MLSDNHAESRTIAFQQSLFLNAFALIEFLKRFLRLFAPRTGITPIRDSGCDSALLESPYEFLLAV